MSHYLPAPYEGAANDDLAAAVGATLTATLALLTAWIVGVPAYDRIRLAVEAGQREDGFSESTIQLGGTGLGWAVAVLFLVFGTVSLLRRRARGGLIFGAVVSLVTTIVADSPLETLTGEPHAWLFYSGIAVVIAALLPATKRWLRAPAVTPPVLAAPPQLRIGQARR